MIAPTAARVENNSDPAVNDRIRDQIRERLARYESANQHELTYRLAELDQEWDIERVLEFNFSSVVLAGITLGAVSGRKWHLLSAIAACFMVQNVIQGWCPPLAVLRRLGYRTAAEINQERIALKIIRGDLADWCVNRGTSTASLLHALQE